MRVKDMNPKQRAAHERRKRRNAKRKAQEVAREYGDDMAKALLRSHPHLVKVNYRR